MILLVKNSWVTIINYNSRPGSIYYNSNRITRFSGHFSISFVFFVLKSLLGIARQWSRENFAVLTLKPPSHVRILIYRKWVIENAQSQKRGLTNTLIIHILNNVKLVQN